MRVARTIASFLTAMALALALVLQATPTPVVAVTGYDSAFLFESDWLIVKPGDTGQAAVTFLNVGSVSWQKGGASQVNLATCCPLNAPPTHAAWASSWLSSTAYATHREDLVAPGGRGTYIWNFKVPADAAPGIYDFPGDLVLAATGEGIHREGYFHRNDLRAAAPTLEPTALDLAPEFQSGQIGTNVTLTATVTADPETGTTTRRAVANAEVTFVVDARPEDVGNADFSRTATTDANGIARLAYTRSNPGFDTINAFVTSKPTVRDTSNVSWTVTANPIVVTPDDDATVANNQCRTYTVEAKKADTGAALANAQLSANFQENVGAATDQDKGATIAGTSPTPTDAVQITTDSSGRTSFAVCGADVTVTPVVFDNRSAGNAELLEAGDLRDTGGKVKFSVETFTVTITPTLADESDVPSQRVFTVEVKNQAGNPAGGADLSIAFTENLDLDTANDTPAVVSWFDNTDPFSTSALRTCTAVPTGTTGVNATVKHDITLNSAGKLTFAICSNSTTTATPVVWVDQINNNARDSAEASASGGQTKFVTAQVGGGRLRSELGNVDEFNGTSTDANITGIGESPRDAGEETFLYTTLNRDGGNFTGGTQTVQFTIANTGTKTFCVQDVSGTESPSLGTTTDPACGGSSLAPVAGKEVAAGSTITFTTTSQPGTGVSGQPGPGVNCPSGVQCASITLDSSKTTKTSITAKVVGVDASSKTATKEWLAPGPAEPAPGSPTPFTVTGTVIATDTGTTTSDGGSYTIKTTAGEIVTITYDTTDILLVQGSVVSEATFEDKLSTGDTIKFTNDTTVSDADQHDITTDVP